MDSFILNDTNHTQGWIGVIISSAACIIGASIVFLDKFFHVSILDNRAFMACSMALASGVLLFSSLSILFPQAQQKLGSNNDLSLYTYFFAGAIFTLLLTKLIHYMMPDAIHACGNPSESCHHTTSDEENNNGHHHHHHHHHHHKQQQHSPPPLNDDNRNQNCFNHGQQHIQQRQQSVKDERRKLNAHRCDVEYGTIRSSESHFRFHHDDLVHSNTPTKSQKTHSSDRLSSFSHPSSSCEDREARHESDSTSTVSESPSSQHHKHHESVEQTVEKDPGHYYSIGIQTAFAICVHKFPEGLIMFVSSQASAKVGLNVSIAMSIHNLTEGFMIALPLYYATRSRTTAFIAAAVMGGCSQPLGALIGLFLVKNISKESENLLFGIVFACVSGMMSLITIQSMLPQAIRADTHQRYVLLFFFIGIFLVGLSSILKALN
ncbi:ZIP zinc transporter-domain-containing protein [Mycotypha africana]|uniref:ZIP zinc transporter-domain-containing protein n=1 Tax=Mycotypha africana TaxID=64632 RepID=UPI002301C63B|nr:ZIP zinc transporter-domain-containing protein [Mycotypha africana]KAI8992178.1 ZIP zinc transporter-domain-containing protein [Mycotypha africana]